MGYDPDAQADRGLIARLDPPQIRNAEGEVVWDADAYAFLDEECPPTAHPGLWEHSRRCARQGLYEVTEGIYQVRGLDLSNMTLVEGRKGVIAVDPLISAECARAGLELYRRHRGDRPVTGVVYTSSHIDHFAGVRGAIDGSVPILAPRGFLTNAVSENVYAGPALVRRGYFYTGALLERGPAGQIGLGLGQSSSSGRISLVAPNRSISRTGQEEVVDGVRLVFQMTPGSEAPAEANFYLPEHRALCMAENAVHSLHNVLDLSGALVRDARLWARYLDESIELFAGKSDVQFASHHWPTWGTEEIIRFLSQQRDMYAYLHDQTLRLMNKGLVGSEIAEELRMPPGLVRQEHTRGYYGSVSHNAKAIYQRYMGWFDGNPAHLWEHPPVEAARRYVDCMGGVDETVRKAEGYRDAGDLRFAATLLDHAVFADPDHSGAREALAGVYESLAYGAECGTWRNFYLQGAHELRHGFPKVHYDIAGEMATGLTEEQLFDALAIRIDGPRAWGESFAIDWRFPSSLYRTTMSNGALIVRQAPRAGRADLSVHLTKADLIGLVRGEERPITTEGDASLLERLLGLLDPSDGSFAIVTP